MRPILLGMNNPLSDDARHALFPAPEGCTGHRVWKMLREFDESVSMKRYLEMFDRRNLVSGRAWSLAAARDAATLLHGELENYGGADRAPDVIVLGGQTWRALGLERRTNILHSHGLLSATFWRIPHPSGRNLWYNEERNRRAAARLMLCLAGSCNDTDVTTMREEG